MLLPRHCVAIQVWTTLPKQPALSSRTRPRSTKCSPTLTVSILLMSRFVTLEICKFKGPSHSSVHFWVFFFLKYMVLCVCMCVCDAQLSISDFCNFLFRLCAASHFSLKLKFFFIFPPVVFTVIYWPVALMYTYNRNRPRGCVDVKTVLSRGWSRISNWPSSSRTLWSSGLHGWMAWSLRS